MSKQNKRLDELIDGLEQVLEAKQTSNPENMETNHQGWFDSLDPKTKSQVAIRILTAQRLKREIDNLVSGKPAGPTSRLAPWEDCPELGISPFLQRGLDGSLGEEEIEEDLDRCNEIISRLQQVVSKDQEELNKRENLKTIKKVDDEEHKS